MSSEPYYNGESENNIFSEDKGKISDGYHTFDELYEHRIALWFTLCKADPTNVFFRKHYETWFVLFWESPKGQVSYHVPEKYWDFCLKNFTHDPEHVWDGHTSNQVVERLNMVSTIS